jgi:hypothetical protein
VSIAPVACEPRCGPSGSIDCRRKTKGWAREVKWRHGYLPALSLGGVVVDHWLLAEQDLPAVGSDLGPGRGSNGGF